MFQLSCSRTWRFEGYLKLDLWNADEKRVECATNELANNVTGSKFIMMNDDQELKDKIRVMNQ